MGVKRLRCVVGKWRDQLDANDKKALKKAISRLTRVELYGHVCAASAERPFGLTALKECLNGRCICD